MQKEAGYERVSRLNSLMANIRNSKSSRLLDVTEVEVGRENKAREKQKERE